MNPTAKSSLSPRLWLWLALLLLPFMLTRDSLWIDEGDTAMYAVQPNFSAWWQYLLQDKAADCQMPLTMLFAWLGGKLLGTDEWQMRAVNLLWGILAVMGMYWTGRRLRLSWLPMLLVIQPFFWFYMDEARPYALEIAGGTWLLVAFVEFLDRQSKGETWAWLFAGSVFLLFLSTILAPVPVGVLVIVGAAIAVRNQWKPSRKAWLILLAGAAANIPAAIYYLSTILRGVRSAMLWHVNLMSLGYLPYELTGLAGLGVPIGEIRTLAKSPHMLQALTRDWLYFIAPAVGSILLLAVFVFGWRRRSDRIPSGARTGLATSLVLTALLFVIASLVFQKALWARHLAPVFPIYVSLLGLAMAGVWQRENRLIQWTPWLLAGLLAFSSLNLRFAQAWRKEDYRSAAHFARDALAKNQSVWWVASENCALYYHLTCALDRPKLGQVYCPQSGFEEVGNLPPPDVIIYSKPDVFDARSVVERLIQQEDYHEATHFISFVVWTNAPPPGVKRTSIFLGH